MIDKNLLIHSNSKYMLAQKQTPKIFTYEYGYEPLNTHVILHKEGEVNL